MPDVEVARAILSRNWDETLDRASQGELPDALAEPVLVNAIRDSINSATKSYRYVLPTQLVAKLADPSVDCRAVQASYAVKGAFDARSIAQKVVVPFERDNAKVLGGSPEPYVNNPLRVPAVSPAFSSGQKDKAGWSKLCKVLDAVEEQNSPQFTAAVFKQVLVEIYRRLSRIKVEYPLPIRISIENTISLIESFLSEKSGGEREQCVTCALFKLFGNRFHLYDKVNMERTTAADAATGLVADLECVAQGKVVLAVEVKDQALTVADIQDTLRKARTKEVAEILFVAQKGVAKEDKSRLDNHIESDFARGQNVYIFDLVTLARATLAIMGEDARRELLRLVAEQLEQYGSDIRHRTAWRELLLRI